jgi:hypothetical protein
MLSLYTHKFCAVKTGSDSPEDVLFPKFQNFIFVCFPVSILGTLVAMVTLVTWGILH